MDPIKNEELIWGLIDFDRTIAQSEGPDYEPREPVNDAVEALHELAGLGHKITVYTARPYADYRVIERWMDDHNMPHRRIICGKPLGRYIIDDKNVPFLAHDPLNWEKAVAYVKEHYI